MDKYIKTRIAELREEQEKEAAAGFPNGERWNELEDKIYFLKEYGQENEPRKFSYENEREGYVEGLELNGGVKIFFSGMTFNGHD